MYGLPRAGVAWVHLVTIHTDTRSTTCGCRIKTACSALNARFTGGRKGGGRTGGRRAELVGGARRLPPGGPVLVKSRPVCWGWGGLPPNLELCCTGGVRVLSSPTLRASFNTTASPSSSRAPRPFRFSARPRSPPSACLS